MTKRLTVQIGYTRYLISEEDAIRLLGIAARSPEIEHKDGKYSDPFVIKENADPFVLSAELVDFEEPEDAVPQPSKYTAAARNLP